MTLFDKILKSRGILGDDRDIFLNPDYEKTHDPFLLPDMDKCVNRLIEARRNQEYVVIYGDYDIDGLTATTLLLDSFSKFGFENVDTFIPNRFIEGYGMTIEAVEKIAGMGATLIVTVDCGSLSEEPIKHAKKLGVDVIVTDHHNVAKVQPPAIGVINPKRLLQDYPDKYENLILKDEVDNDKLYPFLDLPGVGVAFKLVQAMQTKIDGMPVGQEKWLLDLVALGTVCDVVTLVDENRIHVYWGLKVLAKTRRVGLKALMSVSDVKLNNIDTRSLGFGLGPRMNAAGRLETAKYAQDMLCSNNASEAMCLARQLDDMNAERRRCQDEIYKMAVEQAEKYTDDNVLVLSHPDWSHGIIGIVAAKIMEKYKKPTYVLQECGEQSKGSARSFGDFSVADAIRASEDIITGGGGHKIAAGVTLPTSNIEAFRDNVNKFYKSLNLQDQENILLPVEDVEADLLSEINLDLVDKISMLEPFGNGNPEPIIKITNLTVMGCRYMGSEQQHIKLNVVDNKDNSIEVIAFSAPDYFFVKNGDNIDIWIQPVINEWNGRKKVEGKLLHLEVNN